MNVPDAITDAAMDAEVEYARTRRPDGGGHAMPPRDQVRRLLAAAFPLIAAEERARIRDLLPYNVNCCEGLPAAVADMIGEHGHTPWASMSAEDEADIEAVKRAGRDAWDKHHGGAVVADCPFCARIAAGQYDRTCSTPDVVVFAPLNPVTPGHLLVVPRAHVDDATDDPALTGLVFEWPADLADRSVHAVNLITSIGKDATQSVFHLHVHLVPRYADDGLALPWTGQQKREHAS